jgi:hypothetical protein
MIVYPEVEKGPFFSPENQQARRLLAANVAASHFSGLHCSDKARSQGQVGAVQKNLSGLRQDLGPSEHIAGNGKAGARSVACPTQTG